MIELFFLIGFGVYLHRYANHRGLSSTPWILYLVTASFLTLTGIYILGRVIWGPAFYTHPEIMLILQPTFLILQFVIFFLLRNRINQHHKVVPDEVMPPKDLSYFR